MDHLAENGYEMVVRDDEILFADRRTWGLGWFMVALGIVAAALFTLSGASYVRGTMLRSVPAIMSAALLAVILLIVLVLCINTYRARRNQPIEEIQHTLIFDRRSQMLRDASGEIMVQSADVKARMHIDWWTRSAMRIVVLSWPGGHRTIYRTFRRRRCLELLTFLNEQGLDAV